MPSVNSQLGLSTEFSEATPVTWQAAGWCAVRRRVLILSLPAIDFVQVNALVYVGDSKSREVIRTYEFNATRRQGTMRQYKFEVMQLACWTATCSACAGQSSVAHGMLRPLQACDLPV